MLSFRFSEKKFRSLPEPGKHRWIAKWLRQLYIGLDSGDLPAPFLARIYSKYSEIVGWLGLTPAAQPRDHDIAAWREFLANAFHLHCRQTGFGLRESDFLPQVERGDNNRSWRPSLPYLVALDGLRSAFNVGSIARTVDAVGFRGIVLGNDTPGFDHAQVKRCSMGTYEWIPAEKAEDLASYLLECDEPVIGIETVKGSRDFHSFTWPDKAVVVLGNEEYGISQRVLSACDMFVHLPMQGRKNSINVANAFAVIAFAAQHRRLREQGEA